MSPSPRLHHWLLIHAMLAAALVTVAVTQAAEHADDQQHPKLAKLQEQVLAFRDSLSDEQREQLNQPLEWEHWTDWTYFAGRREGVAIKSLNDQQRQQLKEVLTTALSATGYEKAMQIRSLENALGDDPGLYFLAVYGDPSTDAPWGLRWAGHHVVFNWVVRKDRIVASTPQFLGANPAHVQEGSMAGTRTLVKEEELGRELMKMLNASQKEKALLSGEPPFDVLTGRKVKVEPLEPKGIAFTELNDAQKKVLRRLVHLYAEVQAPPIAKARLAKARRERENIHFAWIGGTGPESKHYYRIQGPSFVIEYENARSNTNHIHTVWRDFEGDFGRNVLLDHLKRHHGQDHSHE
jgi:hypothetical protein